MSGFAQQVQMTDLIAGKDDRTDLTTPARTHRADEIEFRFRDFRSAGVLPDDHVRERVAREFLIRRALYDLFNEVRRVEAASSWIVPVRNAVVPVAFKPGWLRRWQCQRKATIGAILASEHQMSDRCPGGGDAMPGEQVEQCGHDLAHALDTGSVVGIAGAASAPSHLKVETDRQHSGCHVESFPNSGPSNQSDGPVAPSNSGLPE